MTVTDDPDIDLTDLNNSNYDGWYGNEVNWEIESGQLIDFIDGLTGRYLHIYFKSNSGSNYSWFEIVDVMAFEAQRIYEKPEIQDENNVSITDSITWSDEIAAPYASDWYISHIHTYSECSQFDLQEKYSFTFSEFQSDTVIVIPLVDGITTSYEINIELDDTGTHCTNSPYSYPPEDGVSINLPDCDQTRLDTVWIEVAE